MESSFIIFLFEGGGRCGDYHIRHEEWTRAQHARPGHVGVCLHHPATGGSRGQLRSPPLPRGHLPLSGLRQLLSHRESVRGTGHHPPGETVSSPHRLRATPTVSPLHYCGHRKDSLPFLLIPLRPPSLCFYAPVLPVELPPVSYLFSLPHFTSRT